MDVLRPVVELINFNLNIIKNCRFPAFFWGIKRKTAQESAVEVSFNGSRMRRGLVFVPRDVISEALGWGRFHSAAPALQGTKRKVRTGGQRKIIKPSIYSAHVFFPY